MGVLKMLGYREKSDNAPEAIYHARMLNVETEKRLKLLKTQLNGEEFWFVKGGNNNERNNE